MSRVTEETAAARPSILVLHTGFYHDPPKQNPMGLNLGHLALKKRAPNRGQW